MFNLETVRQFSPSKTTQLALIFILTHPGWEPPNCRSWRGLYGVMRHFNIHNYAGHRLTLQGLFNHISLTSDDAPYARTEKDRFVVNKKVSEVYRGSLVNDVTRAIFSNKFRITEVLDYVEAASLIHPIKRLRYIHGIDKYITIPMETLTTDRTPILTKEIDGKLYFPYEQKLERIKWQDGLKRNHKAPETLRA